MLTLLISLAPLIINIGTLLLGWFAKNQATAASNQKAFLDAINAHVNDALASVNERLNYQNQVDELQKKAAAADAPPPPQKAP